LKRSKSYLAAKYTFSTGSCDRESLIVPSRDLLLKYGIFNASTSTAAAQLSDAGATVDVRACAALLQRRWELDEYDAMQLTSLVDAARSLAPERLDAVPWGALQWSKVSNCTVLPDLHKVVMESGFFAALSSIKHPLTHFLSKIIPIRCQSRKFDHKIAEVLGRDAAPRDAAAEYGVEQTKTSRKRKRISLAERRDREAMQIRPVVHRLFLCSLLGNYPHCHVRPTGKARAVIYKLFSESDATFLDWAKNNTALFVNSMRDYMVFSIRHNPALLESVADVIQFDKFEAISSSVMDAVRSYLITTAGIETSCLSRYANDVDKHTNPSSYMQLCRQRVLYDMERAVHGGHARILEISYRRPRIHVHELLLSMRKYHPPCPLVHDAPVATEDQDAQEDEWRSLGELDLDSTGSVLSLLKQITSLRAQPRASPVSADKNFNALKYLSHEHYQALRTIVLRVNPESVDAMHRVLDSIGCFGVPHDVRAKVHFLFDCYKNGESSLDKLKFQFGELRVHYPRVYTVLQVASHIIRECQRHHFVVDVPFHIMQAQVNAVQSQHHRCAQTGSLLCDSIHFTYCPSCGSIYSTTKEFHSVFVQTYNVGLRDASVDFSTDRVYCRRRKGTAHEGCRTQELHRICILGKILIFGGKMYCICGQVNCGAIMVLDPEQCAWNELGPACASCTRREQDNPRLHEEMANKLIGNVDERRKCELCGADITGSPEKCFMFPGENYLCRVHRTRYMVQELPLALARLGLVPGCADYKKKVVSVMAEIKSDAEVARQNRAAPYLKMQHRMQKQASQDRGYGRG
jgi:hypothetical protein